MDNPILAPLFQTGPTLDGPMSTPATVPVVGGGEGGIGTIPMGDQSLMSNDRMLAGMSPEQSDMIRRYLGSRNMVGFA